jgi:hypothetical protein
MINGSVVVLVSRPPFAMCTRLPARDKALSVALKRGPARVTAALLSSMFKRTPFVELEGVPPPEGVNVVVCTIESGLFVNWIRGAVPVLLMLALPPMFRKWSCPETVVLFA